MSQKWETWRSFRAGEHQDWRSESFLVFITIPPIFSSHLIVTQPLHSEPSSSFLTWEHPASPDTQHGPPAPKAGHAPIECLKMHEGNFLINPTFSPSSFGP